MNLSFRNAAVTPTARKSIAVANVYTKNGQTLRIPFRTPLRKDCSTCAAHPEQQFIRWFNRQSAANPGFPVWVKSILFIVNDAGCPNCQRRLTLFLGKYRLANKLRLRTVSPKKDCGCRHNQEVSSPEWNDEYTDAEHPFIFNRKGKTGQLNFSEKDAIRANARRQYKGPKLNAHCLQIHHRIPLEYLHHFPEMLNRPNLNNLILLPVPLHSKVTGMWNALQLKGKSKEDQKKLIEAKTVEVDAYIKRSFQRPSFRSVNTNWNNPAYLRFGKEIDLIRELNEILSEGNYTTELEDFLNLELSPSLEQPDKLLSAGRA